MRRVLITDRAWPDSKIEADILSRVGAEVVEAADGSESCLVEMAADVDAIATCWAQVTPAVIRAAKKCQIISRFGIGLDNIDVGVATELGIPVTYVPDYCVHEVADHALSLLLACARQIGHFHLATKQGDYDRVTTPPLQRLSNQRVGLAGFGRIAQVLLPKLRAVGFDVVVWSRSGDPRGHDVPMVAFDELLETSDFVSVHLPLTEETHELFGESEFRRMRDSAYLINTARGALIDESALWTALQASEIAGAALDVFAPEPPDLTRDLFKDRRVIVTPHAAFLSEQSVIELRTRVANQIATRFQGEEPENLVNRQALHDR